MAGWKVIPTASGNIALRTYSNKGGVVRMTNEMVFTPAMAEKLAATLAAQAKSSALAGASAKDDEEFDNLDDEDLDDEEYK